MSQFAVTDASFVREPHLVTALPCEYSILTTSMNYFDKEGYELNLLERRFYQENKVKLGNHLYHVCAQEDWIVGTNEPTKVGPFLDHSMIVTRWDYQESAREQLERHKSQRPVLNKLLNISPKWGIDLSMDYLWPSGEIMEIFHIEMDRHSVEEISIWKERVENIIKNNDWNDIAQKIFLRKNEWSMLNSDDQSDWKCQFIGLPRAYDNFKVL